MDRMVVLAAPVMLDLGTDQRDSACQFNGRWQGLQLPLGVQGGLALRGTQICVTLDVSDSI